ncbi:MAG: uroporphyrinogen-III synthase [Muribaculaceae bacterium]|nr:uroporphyrinogen-III synthase [Muribaculaceae bacterium]
MKRKKILVSQPRPKSDKSPFFDIAEKHDVEVVFRPFIKVEGLTAKEFRQSKITLSDYTAIIFTARTAVDHYFRLCEENRIKVPDTMRYFCTTEAIARYLQKYIVYRKRKIFFGASGHLNDPQLLQALVKNNKEKFLYPVSDVHNADDNQGDEEILANSKIDFTKAVMYRTVSNDFTPEEPFDYDILLFFSPSGIDSLLKNFPDFSQQDTGISIGAFGEQTAKAVEDAGLSLSFSAPTPTAPSMASALDEFLKSQKKRKSPTAKK